MEPTQPAHVHANEQLKAIGAVLHAIGFVIANANLYGVDHNVTRQSLLDASALLRKYLDHHGALDITVHEDGFMAGQDKIASISSSSQLLRARLLGLGMDNLTIQLELQDDEFARFAAVLIAPPTRGDGASPHQNPLESARLPHIQSVKYTYRRLTETDAVVSKSRTAATDGARDGADDADHLTAHILDAVANAGREPQSVTGETPGKPFTDELQRVFTRLVRDPSSRTQKGRQNIKRLLLQTEKRLQSRLTAIDQQAVVKAIGATIEELIEDLEVEGVVAKYLKQKSLFDATEIRILRQLRRAADDEQALAALREKALEAGLSDDIWQDLLFQSPSPSSSSAPDRPRVESASDRAARLNSLLTSIRQAASAAESPFPSSGAQTLESAPTSALARTQETAAEAIHQARFKIGELQDILRGEIEGAAGKTSVPMTRRKLCELLAEIGQELRQPLTVISGTLAMMKNKPDAGASSDPINGLITLSEESCERLDGLIGKIVDIAGFPDTLNPDGRILDALYKRSTHPPS